MFMNIDLCLIIDMKNLIFKLGVYFIIMLIIFKISFYWIVEVRRMYFEVIRMYFGIYIK